MIMMMMMMMAMTVAKYLELKSSMELQLVPLFGI